MYSTDGNNIYGMLHHLRLTKPRILLLGLLIFLITCGSQCPPPKVVDVPASSLDVKIVISDTDPSGGTILALVQFFYNGDYVELGGYASVTCNGVLLSEETLGGLAYAARVPIVPEGSFYTFVHTRNGVATSVRLQSLEGPVFISPTESMTVMRSTNVTITYVAGSSSSIRGMARGYVPGRGTVGVTAGDQPDNGTYTGLNAISGEVGRFDAGPGKLSLTRDHIDTYSGGTGFNSVQSKYTSGSYINIIWQ